MNLVPRGEGGSRLLWLLFFAAIVFGGYGGFMYFHAISSVDSNIASLGDDLSLNGEDHFRRELVSMLGKNGIATEAAEIEVSLDRQANVYDVVVPARWMLALPWKRVEMQKTFRHRIPGRDELGRP
ncbi:MAG: hypothetical protein QM723_14335 [Myxococcaceae bacterium]